MIVVVSCLMRSFLIAVVCMSDSLRASAQIYTVTIQAFHGRKEKDLISTLRSLKVMGKLLAYF